MCVHCFIKSGAKGLNPFLIVCVFVNFNELALAALSQQFEPLASIFILLSNVGGYSPKAHALDSTRQ